MFWKSLRPSGTSAIPARTITSVGSALMSRASEADASAGARGEPDDGLQRARLAGAVCTEQRDDLAGADHKIEVADGLNRSVGDAEILD